MTHFEHQRQEASLPKTESLELRQFLSDRLILTNQGVSNLLGEVIIPQMGEFTTGALLSSGVLLAGTKDCQLLIHDPESKSTVTLDTPGMVTAIHESSTSGRIFIGMNQGILAELESEQLAINQSFLSIPTRTLWHTPWDRNDYDIHSLSEDSSGRLIAAIHVGGVVQSQDGGTNWTQLPSGLKRLVRLGAKNFDIEEGEGLNPDVHQLSFHPKTDNHIHAATRDGFYVSEDGGHTFEGRNNGIIQEGKTRNYQRSFGIFPDKDIWLVASAEGPGEQETTFLYRSIDQGQSWTKVSGLPEPSPHIDTITCYEQGRALALVQQDIYLSEDYGKTWTQIINAPSDYYTDRKHHVVRPLLVQ